MKQLTCEMCGGTDLVKDGGVFICQTCGCKYTVEEAKKMMVEGTVEVAGTVKVSGVAENITKARRAFEQLELGDIDNAEKLYETILEDDNDNFLAYLGMASVENTRQVSDKKIMYYAEKAMSLSDSATDEEKEFVKQILNYRSVDTVRSNGGIPILISAVVNDNYEVTKFLLENGADPNLKTAQGRESGALFFAGVESGRGKPNAVKIGELLIDYGADINAKSSDGYGVLGNGSSGYGNGVSPSSAFKNMVENAPNRAARKYWKEHPEEKAALDSEKSTLESQISNLRKQIEGLPEVVAVADIESRIAGKEKEKNALGLFKGKKKKAIQEQIDLLRTRLSDATRAKESASASFEGEIKQHQKRLNEINDELSRKR